MSGKPVGIVMTSYLLLDWFDIAIRHEQAARNARDADDSNRERQEAMVAAAACAHALEGLHLDLKQRVDDNELRAARAADQRQGRGTDAATNAVLALALGVDTDTWRGRLHELFETLRNPAVHPRAEPREPVPHPDVERAVSVSHESALYWLDSARVSVDLLCEVMERLLESETLAAVELARDIRPRVEQLLAARTVDR